MVHNGDGESNEVSVQEISDYEDFLSHSESDRASDVDVVMLKLINILIDGDSDNIRKLERHWIYKTSQF